MKNRFYSVLCAVVMLFITQVSSAQCSMCRAIVETDISGKGAGINNGIVYLMAFPYFLVALMAFGFVYKMRKDAKLV